MKSIDIVDKKLDSKIKENFLDGVAKKIVLNVLQKMTIGHLTIEDDGEVYSFGEDAQTASVVGHIFVEHRSAYRKVMLNGTIGSGEAYMAGAWRSPDLTQVIRIFVMNMDVVIGMDSKWNFAFKLIANILHKMNANSKDKARENISAHYDLGNDFFKLFLDETMLYSSAIYPSKTATLLEASTYKMQHICKRLGLSEDDHLLEIGTGWGGMAIYAAQSTGCRVTSVTISQEQYEYAKAWVAREGLQEKVDIQLCDYRDITGQFDKLLSIEMIEAVGYQYYSEYFKQCSRLLKDDGKMLIQAITIADQRYHTERDNVDFIQRYIFPGGCLPSNEVIAQHVRKDTDMQIVGLDDITMHYAKTLEHWKAAFMSKLDAVKAQGFDDVFIRMWDFYLCYCEGGFRERVISTSQILLAKPRCKELPSF
ncbi:class I SAM-dependent methyltransferase [Marinagarivorans algicola]|uniref:class I SAM-dependent methyltransferase n=1 Tax=Marinagarivorans algicola TaxID=1513270 RepID=UPI00373544B2